MNALIDHRSQVKYNLTQTSPEMETYYEDCAGKTLRFKLIFSNSTQKKVSYLGENPISFEKNILYCDFDSEKLNYGFFHSNHS